LELNQGDVAKLHQDSLTSETTPAHHIQTSVNEDMLN